MKRLLKVGCILLAWTLCLTTLSMAEEMPQPAGEDSLAAPVSETPAEETPAEETPAEETPQTPPDHEVAAEQARRGRRTFSNHAEGGTRYRYNHGKRAFCQTDAQGQETETLFELEKGDCIQIASMEEFEWFADYINSGESHPTVTWALECSLDFEDTAIEPVGTEERPFSDTFDGNGNKLYYHVAVSGTDSVNRGLFGYAEGAIIQNLSVSGSDVSGTNNIGLLAGYVVGTEIFNCEVSGTVEGQQYVGGLVGYATESVFTDCESTCDVNPSVNSSGYSNHNVYAAGGMVGYLLNSQLTDCVNEGMIATGLYGGGMVGQMTGKSSISRCDNTGSVQTATYGGGMVGWLDGGTIADCTNEGQIQGTNYIGGVAGYAEGAACRVENCTNSGSVVGQSSIGGIVGLVDETTIYDCKNTGTLEAVIVVGGIAGEVRCGTLTRCSNEASMSGTSQMGGIIGLIGEGGEVDISFSDNAGAVHANYGAGGIVGQMASQQEVSLSYCYNLGTISGVANANGIVGEMKVSADKVALRNCYHAADVDGDPICGSGAAEEMLTSCVYDKTLADEDEAAFGLALTTEELQSGWYKAEGETLFWSDIACCYWDFDRGEYPTLLDAPVYTPKNVTFQLAGRSFDGSALTVGTQEGDDICVSVEGEGAVSAAEFERCCDEEWRLTDTSDGAATQGGAPKNVGTYRVTVALGYGKWTSAEISITPYVLETGDFTVEAPDSLPLYNKENKGYPEPTCRNKLLDAADYTWTYAADGPTTPEHPALVRMIGRGNCTGTVEYAFELGLDLGALPENVFTPSQSGVYHLGEEGGTMMLVNDPTVYQGGIGVYLEKGVPYRFQEKENTEGDAA